MAIPTSFPWFCKVWVVQLLFFCLLQTPELLAQQLTKSVEKADSLAGSKERVVKQKEQQADSLMNQKIAPVDKVIHKADSISDLLDAERQINNKINQTEDTIEEKINSVEKVGQTKEALGNIESETGLQLKTNAPAIPQLEGGNTAIDLPTDKVDNIKGLPKEHLSKIKEVEALQETGKVGKEVSSYSQDVKAIREGDLSQVKQAPKAIEQKALQTKELQELQKQSQSLEQMKQQPKHYASEVKKYKDKKYIQQQAANKLKEKAINHFAGRNQELQAAQQELSKLKKKYSHVQTEKNLYVKAGSLKGKPLKERLVLGSSLQIHQGSSPAFDLSPFGGYRFNKRWSLAAGGTYRLTFDQDKQITTVNPVYGGRIMTEAFIHQKLLLHGEYELLRTNIPSQSLPHEQDRAWVEGMMLGIGKEYSITKKLKGNVLTLYNFTYQPQGPYLLRWNIRFGFLIF